MKAPRVLIVDDNQMNLELVSFMLERDHFVIETATDGLAAQALVGSFQPDLILMDIQMPGMDGLALTRWIKAQPGLAHVVVVAFTAYAMKGDEARMREAGCDGYIAKPIDVASFVGRLHACLQSGAQA